MSLDAKKILDSRRLLDHSMVLTLDYLKVATLDRTIVTTSDHSIVSAIDYEIVITVYHFIVLNVGQSVVLIISPRYPSTVLTIHSNSKVSAINYSISSLDCRHSMQSSNRGTLKPYYAWRCKIYCYSFCWYLKSQ